jgi:hypothetical protein
MQSLYQILKALSKCSGIFIECAALFPSYQGLWTMIFATNYLIFKLEFLFSSPITNNSLFHTNMPARPLKQNATACPNSGQAAF